MTNWPEVESKYYLHTFDRYPVTIVRGKGMRVWDDNDKQYLDCLGGLAVTCLGHAHPVVTEAITEQAKILIQTSNLVYTVPQLQLAEILVEHSCLQKIFFTSSGAEANEGAVKLARRYGELKLDGAYEVITVNNSFHGRTLAMTAATAQVKMQEPYYPLPGGFKNVNFNDVKALKQATTGDTCAVMLEVVQGEGGVNTPDEGYFQAVREWCDQTGILLILDEIQTGMGRLGTLFGYEQFGIEPDIMTLAKGMGNGIPIGAFLAKERAAVFAPGEHGSTFGGNPFACAVAYATVKYIIDHDIVGNARNVGNHFLSKLMKLKQKYPFVTDVRGRGLLLAIEFEKDIAQELLLACLEHGLLLNKLKSNALRFVPPLIITERHVDEAVGILDRVLAEISV